MVVCGFICLLYCEINAVGTGMNENSDVMCDFSKLDEFDEVLFAQASRLLKEDLLIALDEYFEDAAAYIGEIENGVETGDIEKVLRGSHPLKSNSKSFGLLSVSRFATDINEECERRGEEKDVLSHVSDLLPLLKESFAIGEKKIKGALRAN